MNQKYMIDKINAYNALPKSKRRARELKNYIKAFKILGAECDKWHDKLNEFPKTNMGTITDEAKKTAEYIEANKNFKIAFKKLQNFNLATKDISKHYHSYFAYVLKEKINIDLIEDAK